MKGNNFLALLILFTVEFASAGAVNGGGGIAVVCRSPLGQIQSAQILDLFEAGQKGLQIIAEESLIGNYRLFMDRWIRMNHAVSANEVDSQIKTYIQDMISQIDFTDQKLPSSRDYTPPRLSVGCSIEQAAIYNDLQWELTVNLELWDALDNQNKMALMAHELVYLNYRKIYGYSDSDKARDIVGRLFSTTPPSRW